MDERACGQHKCQKRPGSVKRDPEQRQKRPSNSNYSEVGEKQQDGSTHTHRARERASERERERERFMYKCVCVCVTRLRFDSKVAQGETGEALRAVV